MVLVDLFRIEVDIEQKMCGSCKKSSSEYYELLVQIRFKYFEDILDLKKTIIYIIEKNLTGINKLEEINNGFDIYFRNHNSMNKVFGLFNRHYLCVDKRSKKLVGKDISTNKDLYRYTQSVTLVNLKAKDEIIVKGVNYIIKAMNKNDLVLLEKVTGRKKVLSYSIVGDYVQKVE